MARVSYVDPKTLTEPDIQAIFDDAVRNGTPRPEIQAIRAHQPDVLRAFTYFWNNVFKSGVVDLSLKELVRMRVATTIECNYCANQRLVRDGEQVASENRLDYLNEYEKSDLFTEREKVALRYTDAITWNPEEADDALWAELHKHFSEPELVELGSFIGFIAGGQRWIRTLNVGHGEVLAQTTGGLSAQAAQKLDGQLTLQP